jgi:hypothetical protein
MLFLGTLLGQISLPFPGPGMLSTPPVSTPCPATISGLTFWVKADAITGLSDGNSLATWTDQSGNGYNATASGTAEPTYKVNILNGLPVVRFNGSSNRMQTAAFNLNQPFSLFVIGMQLAGRNVDTFISDLSGTGFNLTPQYAGTYNSIWLYVPGGGLYFQPVTLTTYNIAGGEVNGTSSLLDWNGNVGGQLQGTLGSSGSSGVSIGGNSAGDYLGGDIAEAIVYSQALSTTNRQIIEGYLAWKWGLETSLPSGHPYYSTPPACGY